MMGRQRNDQRQLFYAFDLETVVPTDHLLRGIDAVLDLSELRAHLSPFYSHTGRPSGLRVSQPAAVLRVLSICFS